MYLDETFTTPLWQRWAESYFELPAGTVTHVDIRYREGGWLSDVTYEDGDLVLEVRADRRQLRCMSMTMGEVLPSLAAFAQKHPELEL